MFNLDTSVQSWIIDSYSNGMSANKIGKTIGRNHHFVQRFLFAQGVVLRSKRESHKAGFPATITDKKFNGKSVWLNPRGELFYHSRSETAVRDTRHYLVEVSCGKCGIACLVTKDYGLRNKRRFCSADCQYAMNSGEHSSNWVGGRKKKTSGHILIYAPDHPSAVKKFVPEHRLIIESHLNRYLSSDEFVHHVNGIKDDNRISNLCVCTAAEHTIAHNSLIPLLLPLLESGAIRFDFEQKKYVLGNIHT